MLDCYSPILSNDGAARPLDSHWIRHWFWAGGRSPWVSIAVSMNYLFNTIELVQNEVAPCNISKPKTGVTMWRKPIPPPYLILGLNCLYFFLAPNTAIPPLEQLPTTLTQRKAYLCWWLLGRMWFPHDTDLPAETTYLLDEVSALWHFYDTLCQHYN